MAQLCAIESYLKQKSLMAHSFAPLVRHCRKLMAQIAAVHYSAAIWSVDGGVKRRERIVPKAENTAANFSEFVPK